MKSFPLTVIGRDPQQERRFSLDLWFLNFKSLLLKGKRTSINYLLFRKDNTMD